MATVPLAPGAYPPPPVFHKLYGPDGPHPPPPPPPASSIRVFGRDLALDEPLVAPLQAGKLFRLQDGATDYKAELRRLHGELLFLFLQLLHTLVLHPTHYAPELTVINQVFSNMQYLINALRPHQARANMEHALQLQIQAHKDALKRVRQQVTAADAALMHMANALVEAEGGDSAESAPQAQQPMAIDEV